MALYNDLINNDTLTREQRAEAIKARGEAERKTYNTDLLKDFGRIGFGSLLSGASAHPIFNIPYVGTGIGGAMYDAGQAIAEGEKLPDIAKRAGRGFVIGETVGAIPYVGKVAGKTKAGQAVGNQASKLFDYLANTKVGQKVAEIAPKVEDVLMTDIKAFNPNKQTVYHGSPADFKKFSNEAIGTGEGAQAHGYGHYTAKNKDVADKRYRERLAERNQTEPLSAEIIYRETGEKFIEPESIALYLDGVAENPKLLESTLQRANNKQNELFESINYIKQRSAEDLGYAFENRNYLKVLEKELDEVNSALMYLDDLPNIDVNILGKNKGQLYKLSIPKDDVMLREGATLAEQPKLLNMLGMNNTDNVKQEMANLLDYIKNNKSSLSSKELNNLRKQYSDLSYKKMLNDPQLKSEVYYEALTDSLGSEQLANEFLLDKGIKGISYNGGIDGESNVIFNPDDIEIVRKYFNQPELWEKLKGLKPNEGAELTAIENALRNPQFPMNEQDFNAYENLGLNYYKNIFQPNSVNVDDYGIVSFGRKNRGKDDITNFKMYPNLFELLSGAKPVNRTNYKNELDRQYDYLENPNNNIYQFIIEDIENNGKRYKMMKNKETGK